MVDKIYRKKIKEKRISKSKYPITEQWMEDATFEEIGKNIKVSKQAAKQKFDAEVKLITEKEGIYAWLSDQLKDKEGKPFAYLDFSEYKSGKLFAHMLKKYLGYHIVQKTFCTLKKTSLQELRAEIFAEVKKEGLPYDLCSSDGKEVGFNNIMLLAGKIFSENFSTGEYKDSHYILARRKESPLLNICAWLNKDSSLEVEGIYNNFPAAYKKEKKIPTVEKLKDSLEAQKKYFYDLDDVCGSKLLKFVGVESRTEKANQED